MRVARCTSIYAFALAYMLPSPSAIAQADINQALTKYERCLLAKRLSEPDCHNLRQDVINFSQVEYSSFVFELVRRSGVKILAHPDAPSNYLRRCETRKLQGFYEPSTRTIMLCTNNMQGSGQGLLAVQHEIVHAAQHCWGGTLSSDRYLKETFFQGALHPADPPDVIESYAREQWANELEARKQLSSTLAVDTISLLYIACRLPR
jgi:hypothetical protein